MLYLSRIKSTQDQYLAPLIELFEKSFPKNERRENGKIFSLLESSDIMSFNAIINDGKLSGLLVYWDLDKFYYIEYLAVFPEMRNQKIGEKTLSELKRLTSPKVLLLESEPISDELTERRINFYLRNGFTILDKEYIQPPYIKGGEGLPLWILGTNSEPEQTESYISKIKNEIYLKHYQ
ncbi:MAG: GNAT family N-acetyltransferase [Candidatus Limimorpha sp.]